MKKYLSWKLLAILVFALFLGIFDLPASTQKNLGFIPESVVNKKIHLGLDLQGGSQLDYKIDLRKVAEADKESIIQGVQEVIERRVNRLGVAEPHIYRSEIGDETHIVVELAETATIEKADIEKYLSAEKTLEELTDDERKLVSLEKAKDTVGKTIQLEFKEPKAEIDENEVQKIRENAENVLKEIKTGADFAVTGQEEAQASPGKISYEKVEDTFASDISATISGALAKLQPGSTSTELIESSGNFIIDESGQPKEDKSLVILKLNDRKEEVKYKKEVDVSHILIAYKGLENAPEGVTRTEEEAEKLANDIKKQLDEGADFAALAKEKSDDPGSKDLGGVLTPAVSGQGDYVFDFEQTALKLEKNGDISDIVKTQFGFHIIKANTIRSDVKEPKLTYEIIKFSTQPDSWQDTGLTGEHFKHADVQINNLFQPFINIQFNDEGAKFFEEITGRNVGKPIAIFVGGEQISAPNVSEKIAGGVAQITGQFTQEEAQNLARDLNTGAIPAPIILTGEYTIGATLGQEALDKSVKAGFIGLMLVIIFMIAYYRLPGVLASLALLIYGGIFLFIMKAELHTGLAISISLIVFGTLVYKIVNSRELGWEKFLSFILACAGFFFVTFLLKTGVVLTLAGIAGVILSIGMAVDANILIFERMKEELRDGKPLQAAIETGFARAWSAIRDSNFSALITCVILFYFGSSIIRGFAFNLAAGILISMFTAITISRTLLHVAAKSSLSKNLALFGASKKGHTQFKFIQRGKLWLSLSAVATVISIIAILAFKLNLGIDFTGGTLMEFKFKEPVTKEQFTATLQEASEKIPPTTSAANTETEQTTFDVSSTQVIPSGENGFILKTKYISSETHEALIKVLEAELPEFTEPRFTTIGPTIGKDLLNKAVMAIVAAAIMIILYLAFAFRQIPKEVSPWKFGITAIVALLHDIIVVTGIFVVLGKFMHVEIDALFITAMLTVFGYSVHDTIIILDRLRENLIHSSKSFDEVANESLNQTLARSINTSLATVITMTSVLIFGSGSIFYFVLALTIGIIIGTYSSIFVATPLLAMWQKHKDK